MPNTTTTTVYTVTPDDHYYPNTTCHHCHNLQHYLLNITKYFTSNTQLLFLPGLHHLHTDLIIQNVHNISLIGSTANGTTLNTVIIHCNSSVGIVITNVTKLTITNLVIENCTIKRNYLYAYVLTLSGMTLSQCYNIQLQDITVYGSDKSAVLAVNILGNSSFVNLTSYGMIIEYNEIYVLNNYNKLLVENYQGLFTTHDTLITIHLYQYSYQVSIEICNADFTGPGSNHTDRLFKVMQRANTFRNSIHFNQCIFENFIYTNPWLSKNYFILNHHQDSIQV